MPSTRAATGRCLALQPQLPQPLSPMNNLRRSGKSAWRMGPALVQLVSLEIMDFPYWKTPTVSEEWLCWCNASVTALQRTL